MYLHLTGYFVVSGHCLDILNSLLCSAIFQFGPLHYGMISILPKLKDTVFRIDCLHCTLFSVSIYYNAILIQVYMYACWTGFLIPGILSLLAFRLFLNLLEEWWVSIYVIVPDRIRTLPQQIFVPLSIACGSLWLPVLGQVNSLHR